MVEMRNEYCSLRQWDDFFFCVEYCTSVELKCIKCGTLKKKTRYSEWNATEFKFPMRKHRLKIAERF